VLPVDQSRFRNGGSVSGDGTVIQDDFAEDLTACVEKSMSHPPHHSKASSENEDDDATAVSSQDGGHARSQRRLSVASVDNLISKEVEDTERQLPL
jgi:hypothetical protein